MNLVRKIVMYFTLQEREKRSYERYEINRKKLESLTDRNLHEKYIKLKSTYEFKKGFFTFFGVTLALSILTGMWKNFYQVFQRTLKLFFYQENSIEATKVILIVYIGIVVTIVIAMFIWIIIYLKNMYRIYEQLLLIEEIRAEKIKGISEE
ncbi:hypothetical protein [Clostridium baratii]|uniref:hypothetical protein n=1 Tax=Clostridium baratii TaxID=1561 RepID=UPI0030D620D4